MAGHLYIWFMLLLIPNKGDSADVWIEFEEHEYLFRESELSWDDANTSCAGMQGSNLASILTGDESMFINGMIDDKYPNSEIPYWIGLHHKINGCQGCRNQHTNNSICSNVGNDCCSCRLQWEWTDGSLMSFMNWMINEPTGERNPCGRISRATNAHLITQGLYWFDFECVTESRFICKRRKESHDIPNDEGTDSNENNSAATGNKNKDSESNGDMVIGVSVGLTVVILGIVAVVVFFVLRRKRQKSNNKQKNDTEEEHVYYNESKLDPAPAYVNHVAVKEDTSNNDNAFDPPSNDTSGTTYAQVILPTAKPKPLKPKPVQNKVIQYAEIDLSPSGTQPNNGFQGEYSSVDSLDRVRTLSYEDGYAGMEDDTSNTADTAQNPNALTPQPQLTEKELQEMYAQPMKKNKGDKSPQVMHRPAPNATGVLYAVPMK